MKLNVFELSFLLHLLFLCLGIVMFVSRFLILALVEFWCTFSCLLFYQSFSKLFYLVNHICHLHLIVKTEHEVLKFTIRRLNHGWWSYTNAQNINISRQNLTNKPPLIFEEYCNTENSLTYESWLSKSLASGSDNAR